MLLISNAVAFTPLSVLSTPSMLEMKQPLRRSKFILRNGLKDDSHRAPREVSEGDHGEDLVDAWRLGIKAGRASAEDVARRFLDPQVDDPGLILADTLVAGVVVPGIEVLASAAAGAPLPHWVALSSLGLVGSVLTRGATLAACFVTGAFAAKCYDRRAYDFPGVEGRFVPGGKIII